MHALNSRGSQATQIDKQFWMVGIKSADALYKYWQAIYHLRVITRVPASESIPIIERTFKRGHPKIKSGKRCAPAGLISVWIAGISLYCLCYAFERFTYRVYLRFLGSFKIIPVHAEQVAENEDR